MAASQFTPSNPFSRFCSLTEAAILWHGLPADRQPLVTIADDGLPYLAGVPDLTERAEAILEAIWHEEITLADPSHDQHPVNMHLLRDSATAWIAEANRRLALPVPVCAAPAPPPAEERLLTNDEVCLALSCSRSTLKRMRDAGKFPKPLLLGGRNRWPVSVIRGYIAAGIPAATAPVEAQDGDI